MNWREKLEKFLNDFKYKDDVIGVLACGSYITGKPTSHSDLDVHIILKKDCDYRLRTTKFVDGLLIECFVNPADQIRKYMQEDYNEIQQSSMNQFATGVIVRDDLGEVAKLKEEAKALLAKKFCDVDNSVSELTKYAIWDMLDDLEDAYKEKKSDFDFIYYNNLNYLLSSVLKSYKYPYGKKVILGALTNPALYKQKYSLSKFEDEDVGKLIIQSITAKSKKKRLNAFRDLANLFWNKTGGFEINTFEFKSATDIW